MLESGEKHIYINPQYMLQPEDLPPEYEEDETPDYNILVEDRINELLGQLEIPNYDTVELQFNQEGMTDKLKQTFLGKKLIKLPRNDNNFLDIQ